MKLPEKFFVKKDLTQKQVRELVLYSKNDPEIIRFTSDSERFATSEKVKLWVNLGRVVYSLTDNKGNLHGIIWFGVKKIPLSRTMGLSTKDYKVTFAIRLYGEARGRGLAEFFMRKCFQDYLRSRSYKKLGKPKFWLKVSLDNIPAIKTYRKFGFRKTTKPDKAGKIIMATQGDFMAVN